MPGPSVGVVVNDNQQSDQDEARREIGAMAAMEVAAEVLVYLSICCFELTSSATLRCRPSMLTVYEVGAGGWPGESGKSKIRLVGVEVAMEVFVDSSIGGREVLGDFWVKDDPKQEEA
ncbi:hypothetical protein AK812_SmicGene28453 [Symbiodinium microadriaticum]|uniref:Uncharacterized protein n=1 Tax=Symbiodinium microadriaticum TaxID=2951 RepID=A0A1Q9D4D9_SYMMI|nr:hypothetical protein AK812_SmicGene28453 [Symbiodinium microadriaticum]